MDLEGCYNGFFDAGSVTLLDCISLQFYFTLNNFEEDEKLRDILKSIISFTGINIEIIGCWIWVDGDTFVHKDNLKTLGFKWAREKKKWYFHTEAFRKRSHKKLSIEDIRNYYGSTDVQTEDKKRLKQA